MSEECWCGHVLDEHEDSFMGECTLCECEFYEEYEGADEEDDDL